MFIDLSLILGCIIILYLLNSNLDRIPSVQNYWTFLIIFVAIIMIYNAPFGFDRIQYKKAFENPEMWGREKDPGWELYNSIYRQIFGSDSNVFFFFHDIIYTLLFVSFAWIAIKSEYRYYFLLLLFISLGYYNGGTNVMRSGFANALIYLAMSRYLKCNLSGKGILEFICISVMAITIHFSVLLTILSLIVGYLFPKVRVYFFIWLGCVILSYLNLLEPIVEPINNILDPSATERLDKYLLEIGKEVDIYQNAGWRLDFIIYSAVPLIFAFYYIRKCKYKDKFYHCVLCAYLIANSYWLCVIKMPFTDRVAYLSWCLIPIVTVYPILSNHYKAKASQPSMALLLSFIMPLGLDLIYLIRLAKI